MYVAFCLNRNDCDSVNEASESKRWASKMGNQRHFLSDQASTAGTMAKWEKWDNRVKHSYISCCLGHTGWGLEAGLDCKKAKDIGYPKKR